MTKSVSSAPEILTVLQIRPEYKKYNPKNFANAFCIDETNNLVEIEQVNFDVIVFEGENRVVN